MSIQQRGKNTWRITLSNGFDDGGSRVRITKTVKAENKTEAEKIEKILAAEIIKKGTVGSKMTLRAFFEYFIANYARPKLASKTIQSYQGLFYRVDLAIGHKPIDKIEPKHILAFLSNLRECPRLDGKLGGLSPGTLKKIYAMLHVLFSKALDWKFIIFNPMEGVDPPEHRYKNDKVILTKEQVGKFMLAMKATELKYQIWCEIAVMCGLRREEIYGLQWKHIHFTECKIRIEQACSYTKEKGVHIKDPKNYFSRRTISMPKSLAIRLVEYMEKRQRARDQLANKWEGAENFMDDFLFTTWNGRVGHPDTMTKWLHKFVRANGLPSITPHSFRHMTATYLINAGVDVVTVAGKLGHANSTTTQLVYAHLLQKSEQETAGVMEDIVFKSVEAAERGKW